MQDDAGDIVTDPKDIAKILMDHWGRVFKGVDVDAPSIQLWLRPARQNGATPTTAQPGAWRLRRQDLIRALRLAGNSRPGPDGIPFEAWRKLGDLGIDILMRAGRQLEQGLSPDIDDHLRFNEALMVCLPKSPTGEDAEGRPVFTAGETRPLAITNSDNRLLASAFRWR